jgi:hypothetical protein
MFKFFRKTRAYDAPPTYDECPTYNESIAYIVPSYEESNKEEKLNAAAILINELNKKGEHNYIVVDDDIVKEIVSEIVNKKHYSLTLYEITNHINADYIITINKDTIIIKSGQHLNILGYNNLIININSYTISGNKCSDKTPQCIIHINKYNNCSIVYHHIAAYK